MTHFAAPLSASFFTDVRQHGILLIDRIALFVHDSFSKKSLIEPILFIGKN